MFDGKFVKWVFLAMLREYIFYNVEWAEVRKINEVFERNGIAKWVIFSASFFFALRLSDRKS